MTAIPMSDISTDDAAALAERIKRFARHNRLEVWLISAGSTFLSLAAVLGFAVGL